MNLICYHNAISVRTLLEENFILLGSTFNYKFPHSYAKKNVFPLIDRSIGLGGSLGSSSTASWPCSGHTDPGTLCRSKMMFIYSLDSDVNSLEPNILLDLMLLIYFRVMNAGCTWPFQILSSVVIDMDEHEASAPLVTLSITFGSTI